MTNATAAGPALRVRDIKRSVEIGVSGPVAAGSVGVFSFMVAVSPCLVLGRKL
jgi:hypothetical protein